MQNVALITGASSGIGRELARCHAAKGSDLILTARREDSLNTLKQELEAAHGVTAQVIALDLGAEGGAEQLCERIEAAGWQVDILINNAGFGGRGIHVDRDIAEEQAMIDLNVKSLVTLCHRIGGAMAARGKGRILNVGSTAGFMPGPLQAVYFGTKAFVNSFSQALDHELRPKGVTCTLLAPGYVETEFAALADLEGTDLTKSGATPDDVAKMAYDGMMNGQLLVINDGRLRFAINWVIPFLPRRMVMKMTERMQSK